MRRLTVLVLLLLVATGHTSGAHAQGTHVILCPPETGEHPCDCQCVVVTGAPVLYTADIETTPTHLFEWSGRTALGIGMVNSAPEGWMNFDDAQAYWSDIALLSFSSGDDIRVEFVYTPERAEELALSSDAVGSTRSDAGNTKMLITINLVHFDLDQLGFNGIVSGSQYDAFMIQAHEIGHALGLDHVYDSRYVPCTIMTSPVEGIPWPTGTVDLTRFQAHPIKHI